MTSPPPLCNAAGCDTNGQFVVLVPDQPLPLLEWAIQNRDIGVAMELGCRLAAYCDFHIKMVREDKLEIIDDDGRRYRIYVEA